MKRICVCMMMVLPAAQAASAGFGVRPWEIYVLDEWGQPLTDGNLTITVYAAGGTAATSIYANEYMLAKTNPVTPGNDAAAGAGVLKFYSAATRLDFMITSSVYAHTVKCVRVAAGRRNLMFPRFVPGSTGVFTGSDGDTLSIVLNTSDVVYTTSDGSHIFTTSEGTNTHNYLISKGKGTGDGYLRAMDGAGTAYVDLYHDGTSAFLVPQTGGVNMVSDANVHGTLTVDGNMVSNYTIGFKAVVDNGNSGAAKTIDWRSGNYQKVTLTDNCTFTFTAPPYVCHLTLEVIQDAGGGNTVDFPATVRWEGAVEVEHSGGASAVDVYHFSWNGANYNGSSLQNVAVVP